MHTSIRLKIAAQWALWLLTLALLPACTAKQTNISAAKPIEIAHQFIANPRFIEIAKAGREFEKDRLAILALQGEFQANFHFEETVALTPGYSAKPSKDTQAYETVVLISQTDQLISLQHLLVVGAGDVIKHWREDWQFEASHRFEFSAHQFWQWRAIKPELRTGHWTQCVFEVSDAPRYCGTGKFNHKYGVSTWTSDRTWRPLPRRDYTQRSDYNAINAENRITITPSGWTHEQDNTKTIRSGEQTTRMLTREFGFNDYRSVQGFDFQPAYDYWTKSAPFWAQVRAAWSRRIEQTGKLTFMGELTDTTLMQALDELAQSSAPANQEALKQLLSQHTRTY